MELFIPSLIVLILGAIVCFFILPKMTPYTLGFLSLSLFILGIWQNYKMFPHEYKEIVKVASNHSSFIVLSLVIIGSMIAIMRSFGGTPPPVTNVVPAAVVNAVNSVIKPFNLAGNNNVRNNGKTNSMNLASTSFKTV